MTSYATHRAPRTTRPATERQRAFIASLVADRDVPAGVDVSAVETLTSREASNLISTLQSYPRKRANADRDLHAPATPPAGHYAVEYGDVLRFYVVKPGKGRWEGRTFLNRFRSDYMDRVGRDETAAVYAAINSDVEAARKRFSDETVCCYACGRRLTDAESRALGIGPECRKRA